MSRKQVNKVKNTNKKSYRLKLLFILLCLFVTLFFVIISLQKNVKEYNWGPIQNEKVSLHPYLGFVLPYDDKDVNALGFYGPLIDKKIIRIRLEFLVARSHLTTTTIKRMICDKQ